MSVDDLRTRPGSSFIPAIFRGESLTPAEEARQRLAALGELPANLTLVNAQLAQLKPIYERSTSLDRAQAAVRWEWSTLLREQRTAIEQFARRAVSKQGVPADLARRYLAAIGERTGKYVGRLFCQNAKELRAAEGTRYTPATRGDLEWRFRLITPNADLSIKVSGRDLPDLFPSAAPQNHSVSGFLRELQQCRGFCIPFNRHQSLHLLRGRPLETARALSDSLVYEHFEPIAREELTARSPEFAARQARLERCQRLFDIHQRYTKRHQLELTQWADLDADRRFLERAIELYDQGTLPLIEKQRLLYGQRYTLTFDNRTVYRLEADGSFSCITTGTKKDPFTLERAHGIGVEHGRLRANLGMCDYCNSEGTPLLGEARQRASLLFSLVENSVRLFPTDGEAVIRKKAEKLDGHQDLRPRHWGQEFLQSCRPQRVTSGAIFPDGRDHWKVYEFPSCLVIEADSADHATFIVSPGALDLCMTTSRTKLTELRPDGYIDRVIHSGEREPERQEWREKVERYIRGT